MRQLIIRVPEGHGEDVLRVAADHDLMDVSRWGGREGDAAVELVLLHVPNPAVEQLVAELGELPDVRLSMAPTGILVLAPPAEEAPEQVRDVGSRSPLEVFLAGLQSVGSWRGFLGYAATAGAVVWLGLITNTIYLLVAAMLLAPFASPAINTAIGTARGDLRLIGRSVGRYAAAIAVTVLVCAALSLLYGLEVETQLMADVASVSALALILPITAGLAGGLHLISGERNSLVSGAAVGILVAASLAPPAGLVGIAAVIGEWEMVASGAWLVALQLVGINVAAAVVFRLHGLSPRGPRFARGTARVGLAAGGAAALVFAGLVVVQLASPPPFLVRSSLELEARTLIAREVAAVPGVWLVNADVRFTRADIPDQDTLLIVLHVQRASDEGEVARPADAETADLVRERVRLVVTGAHPSVTPLVDVTVLEGP
jgi:uncharacterized hydrophobic protein (TIGR00271 family)